MGNVEKAGIKDRRGKQIQVRERSAVRHPRKRLLTTVLSLLLLASVLAGVGARLYITAYHDDLPLARTGMYHLRAAEALFAVLARNPLATQDVALAQHEFGAALDDFTRVDNDLRLVLGVGALLPLPAGQLHAAVHLIPLGIAIAQAGVEGCNILDLLAIRMHNPLNGRAVGITTNDLDFIASTMRDMHSSLSTALSEADQLRPADLQYVPGGGGMVNTLRRNGSALMGWFNGIEQLLPAAAALLGVNTPANYLVEVLDTTELRPGGGFIGNYGIATFAGGQLSAAHITDTYLLDRPYEAAGFGFIPPEYQWFDVGGMNLGLRDSNLDADFPKAARTAEATYKREGGNVPLQGVIAITPLFIEKILPITGPISVPEYHETVNAQNLVALIHRYQVIQNGAQPNGTASPDGHSSVRKRFTELLAEHLLARIHQLAPSETSQFLPIMSGTLHTKDLQIYFNEPTAEALLNRAHLDDAIQVPQGDDVMVVDTNIAISKANSFLKNTLVDQVTIDAEGNAIHHMTLHYDWTAQGCTSYRDYVRVYAPRTSTLLAQNGWQPRGTGQAFGHEVWAGFFTIDCGQAQTISLTWSVPHAAIHTTGGWQYQDLIQKQAGSAWTVHVQVVLPACTTRIHATGGSVSAHAKAVQLDQELDENTALGVDYACS